ncbi:iron-siderophore ABC transporter substrate-binding protein [Arsenicicoccus bolidensis]|uniref:iron-siderophore ABC transporter substrate-binding protein n=1 Tax=Arsenicicoccus bolidensis TaxID=229480 RepID=UPI00041F42AC|nr:iron-siderophore ABC transporter substrate-binding protein [Arsenicicoccus bolidensis]
MPLTRRSLLVLTSATLALAACGAGSSGSTSGGNAATSATASPGSQGSAAEQGAFPVTIKHAFGETTISKEPTRVATVGWVDQDMAVSLGVVPVGATAMTWGGNAGKSTDWFDAAVARLGGKTPTRYDDTDGIPVTEIAKLAPDVILATSSGLTKADYDKLSKIAPVVAQPGAPWVTPWTTSLETVGKALGRPTKATAVRAQTDKVVADAKAAHPELAGKTMVFAYLTTTDLSQIGIYGKEDNRVRALEAFGLRSAPIVGTAVKPGQFYGNVSAEQASTIQSDVLLTYADKPADIASFKANPLIGQIPALKSGHAYAEVDKQIGLSVTNPSPLSMPFIIDKYLPGVVKAVKGA